MIHRDYVDYLEEVVRVQDQQILDLQDQVQRLSDSFAKMPNPIQWDIERMNSMIQVMGIVAERASYDSTV